MRTTRVCFRVGLTSLILIAASLVLAVSVAADPFVLNGITFNDDYIADRGYVAYIQPYDSENQFHSPPGQAIEQYGNPGEVPLGPWSEGQWFNFEYGKPFGGGEAQAWAGQNYVVTYWWDTDVGDYVPVNGPGGDIYIYQPDDGVRPMGILYQGQWHMFDAGTNGLSGVRGDDFWWDLSNAGVAADDTIDALAWWSNALGFPGLMIEKKFPDGHKETYPGPSALDMDGDGSTESLTFLGGGTPGSWHDPFFMGVANAAQILPPAEVWVDDNFGASTPGWGVTHFAVIQDGINAVGSGGTVWVADGTYQENIVIPKSLNLYGSGTSTSTVYPAVSDPGTCGPPALGNSQLVVIQADNVTISGFVFDGDNPNLTSGVVFGGADIDARNGIVTDPVGFPDKGNNLKVLNCVIRNFFLRGVEARGVTGISGIEYRNNEVSNVQACPGNSLGLSLHTYATGKIWDNAVTYCDCGIFVHNHSDGEVIENEVHHSASVGIGVNGNDAKTVICFNTVTDGGIEGCIQTVSADAEVEICCNEVSSDDSDGIVIMGGQSYPQQIYDNYVHDGGNNIGLKITTDLYGWGYEDSHGVNAWGNRIIDWGTGVLADVPVADVGAHSVIATVSGNDIRGNTTLNADNNDAGSTLNATKNWWGSKADPSGTIGGNVNFVPWAEALVTLTPWRQELYICQEVTLDIVITADELYGLQMILHFDPSNLEVAATGWDDTWFHPDQLGWDLVVDNVNGTVKIAASQQYDQHPDPVSGSGRVAWITFHCTAQSIDHITLEDLILADIDGEEIPSTYTSACIKNIGPQPGGIDGTVDLQGRSDESGAVVTALPGGYDDTTDSAGDYAVTQVPPGTYTVIVEMARYLDATKGGVLVNAGAVTTLGQVKLLGGDANDDDIINILDLSIIGGAFGTSPPSNAKGDINDDGTVNILDLVLAGGNYTKTSPVPWP